MKPKFNQASWNYPEETEILVIGKPVKGVLKEKPSTGKPNKQKIDWESKLMTLMVITVADALFAGRTRPITKDCSDVTVKHHKKISKFISQLLLTQRQQLISEIEGILYELSGGSESLDGIGLTVIDILDKINKI